MNTRLALRVGVLLTLGALAYSLVLYPSLPERIPIHWNLRGQVDGWAPKAVGAFLLPGGMALMAALMLALPALSPRGFDPAAFRETFNYVLVLVVGLFGWIHVMALQAALHPGLSMGRPLVAGILLALALVGNVLGKVRRNFWMGIRTPWTLASEAVWNRTHRLGARLLVAAGLAGAVLIFLGAPLSLALSLLMAALLAPAVYSYTLYRRLEG